LGTGEAVIGVETSEDPEDVDEVPTGDKGRSSGSGLEMPETTL
jgi:hypothetical protein